MAKIDITGQRFFKWEVLVLVGFDEDGQAMFAVQCDCGSLDVVSGISLRRGRTSQCDTCASRVMGKARGHKNIDGIKYKYCPNCRSWRPLDYYHHGSGWDGFTTWCTYCNGYPRSRHA